MLALPKNTEGIPHVVLAIGFQFDEVILRCFLHPNEVLSRDIQGQAETGRP